MPTVEQMQVKPVALGGISASVSHSANDGRYRCKQLIEQNRNRAKTHIGDIYEAVGLNKPPLAVARVRFLYRNNAQFVQRSAVNVRNGNGCQAMSEGARPGGDIHLALGSR